MIFLSFEIKRLLECWNQHFGKLFDQSPHWCARMPESKCKNPSPRYPYLCTRVLDRDFDLCFGSDAGDLPMPAQTAQPAQKQSVVSSVSDKNGTADARHGGGGKCKISGKRQGETLYAMLQIHLLREYFICHG